MTPNGPQWTGKIELIPALLDVPLRRRKPTTWFISMSDVFHESLSNEKIAAVFGVMAAARWHRFQVLTKRSARMVEWFAWITEQGRELVASVGEHPGPNTSAEGSACIAYLGEHYDMGDRKAADAYNHAPWPLPSVWLGCSVESAKYKTRIDDLRNVPAAVRFLSLEPLLERLGELDLSGISQCIVGAESGHGARPMVDEWVREIRDQCIAQNVAFFYKQRLNDRGHKVSLPMLDGQQWAQMPTVQP